MLSEYVAEMNGLIKNSIAEDIFDTIRSLYRCIVKVELKTGSAIIMHTTIPEMQEKIMPWDECLDFYLEKIHQPIDWQRNKRDFCLEALRDMYK